MKLTLKQATKVAKTDYEIGILSAVFELQKLGFNCNSYFETINKIDTDWEDFDSENIKARNNLYALLGIKDIMNKAYNKVWR